MPQTHIKDQDTNNVNHLAFNRTVYAYERTALAYLRTSMTFLIASITLVKLFTAAWVQLAGLLLIPMVLYLFILGLLKYREMNKLLSNK